MNGIDLAFFPAGRSDRDPALIICPGGGYWRYGPTSTEPIAEWLNSIGISAFVLRYPLAPERHPAQFNALSTVIRSLRASPSEYSVDPSRVGVIGFSAGGHLAAMVATARDLSNPTSPDQLMHQSSRPDLLLLCYPVVTFGEFTHEGTVANLLGEDFDSSLRISLSNENRVTAETPPTFIWSSADDSIVPIENSLLFAGALSKNKVPFELHIFPNGDHGLGLASDDPILSQWTALAEVWLRKSGF